MRAKGFDSALKELRANTKKYGNHNVIITRIDKTLVEFSHVSWPRTFVSYVGVIVLMNQVSFFILDSKRELKSFLEEETVYMDLDLNETLLFQKMKGRGVTALLPKITLGGGIITLILSFVLYMTGTESSGYVHYSRSGNSAETTTINWLETLIIGSGMVLVYVGIKISELIQIKGKKYR